MRSEELQNTVPPSYLLPPPSYLLPPTSYLSPVLHLCFTSSVALDPARRAW